MGRQTLSLLSLVVLITLVLLKYTVDNQKASHTPVLYVWLSGVVSDSDAVQYLEAPWSPPSADLPAAVDVRTIIQRRIEFILTGATGTSSVSKWLLTLGANGKWPDAEIDYSSGCKAQRANWPATSHLRRVLTLTTAWKGGTKASQQYFQNSDLRATISKALAFWFQNDFGNPSCLDAGGSSSCPCGTPGFWNTNWFSNVIRVPQLIGETCLLLNNTLTPWELSNCVRFTRRAYDVLSHGVNNIGFLTGANTLDVAAVGVDSGLLTMDVSLIADAFRRVHDEVVTQDGVMADGIRRDGSFGQHGGLLYNGNYGKDYVNDVLALELEVSGTQFAADKSSIAAFESLIDADLWMIYRNVLTNVLHWDLSTLGRFISFPVTDKQATASIKVNLTQIQQLGQQWGSRTLSDAHAKLSVESKSSNTGSLAGNRMFYNNDYMVHRGPGYVMTLKMYSTRTLNTECVNSQNPFGFHLSDGTVHIYLQGDEYEDIASAWDWYLVPGITVDYGATLLDCSHTRYAGMESFVGGVSNGKVGIAVMRYTNPFTKSLGWQKVWFFLEDDIQHVMVSSVTSNSTAPVYSVLDQKKHKGEVFVDGYRALSGNYSKARSLWHGGVGYTFGVDAAIQLSLAIDTHDADWSTIGISTQAPTQVDLFAAWLYHFDLAVSTSYSVFPATDYDAFVNKSSWFSSGFRTLRNDKDASAVLDTTHHTAMIVFWNARVAGEIEIGSLSRWTGISVTVRSAEDVTVIIRTESGIITVADPSQSLTIIRITLATDAEKAPMEWGGSSEKTLIFELPVGGMMGSSVSQTLWDN